LISINRLRFVVRDDGALFCLYADSPLDART
jgi:hypothetical protein